MNLKEIAQKTGFSESTVSRALNNDRRISQKTKKIIQDFASKSGYIKNFAAVNLNQKEANILAIVFPPENLLNISNTFYLEIMKEVSYEAQKHDYMVATVIVPDTQTMSKQINRMIVSGRVRKFIILYNTENNPLLDQLSQAQVEFVVVGNPHRKHTIFVDNDNYGVGAAVAEYSITNYQQIKPIFIASSNQLRFEMDRFHGLESVYHQHQIRIDLLNVKRDFSGTQLQKSLVPYNVLIFSSDELLIHLYSLVLMQTNKHIISFNNSAAVQPISKHVLSVDLKPSLIGKTAAKLIFKQNKEELSLANYVAFSMN